MAARRRWLTVDGNPDNMTVRQKLLWTLRAVMPITILVTDDQAALLDAITVHHSISAADDRRLLGRIAAQMGVDGHDMQVVAYLLGVH